MWPVAASLVALGMAACGGGHAEAPPPSDPVPGQVATRAAATPRERLDDAQRLSSLGQYEAAAETFQTVRREQPDAITSLDGLKMAVVYAETGDLANYNDLIHWLVERYPAPTTVTDAERSVKGYIVYPRVSDPAMLAHAVEMTRYAGEHAAEQGQGEYQGFFDTARGVALYRIGRFDEAATWFPKVLDHDSVLVRTLALPFYAMTELKRGNRAHGEELLARARRAVRDLPTPDAPTYGADWTDTLIARSVLKEAEMAFGQAGRASEPQ